MEQYNERRIVKKKSSAPSREEIKERIDQGIARNDENMQKGKDQEERDRRDRDKEYSTRLKKRQRALGVQSVPKGSVMGPYSNSPIGPPNQDPHYSKMTSHRRGERCRERALSTEEEDEGYRGEDGDNDSVTKPVKIKHRLRVTGRATTLEKLPPNISTSSNTNIGSNSMKRIKEEREGVFPVSEAESKRMAEMMLELHCESSNTKYYDSNVPMVSCDSPSSLIISGDYHSKNIHAGDAHRHADRDVGGEGDGIDALFSPFSAASSDTDSFIRQMKERSGEVTSRSKGASKAKGTKGKWSPKRGDDLEKDSFIGDSGNVSDDGEGIRTGERFNKYDCVEVRERKRTDAAHSRLLSSKLSRDISKSDLKSSSVYSQQPFGLVGPQWVAEVLDTDENEQRLVMMYSEGFSMFMAEEGIIEDPLSLPLLSLKSKHSGER